MGASIWTGISNICSAIAGWFGWETEKDKELNTPAMKANSEQKIIQQEEDHNSEIIAKGDLNEIRKEASD